MGSTGEVDWGGEWLMTPVSDDFRADSHRYIIISMNNVRKRQLNSVSIEYNTVLFCISNISGLNIKSTHAVPASVDLLTSHVFPRNV